MLREHAEAIDSVHVTLDSHQRMHIAHGVFWQDEAGNPPAPFTLFSTADVVTGVWRAVKEADQAPAPFAHRATGRAQPPPRRR